MKFYKLKQTDIIQKDDEFYSSYGIWRTIGPGAVGKRKREIFGWYVKMRRRIADKPHLPETYMSDGRR